MFKNSQLIITCEHGGNDIPCEYQSLFASQEDLLNGHRGYDPGALKIARKISLGFDAPLHFSKTSRLLVDLNRSLHHPRLFSPLSKTLPHTIRQNILCKYYFPYRDGIEKAIQKLCRRNTVLHLSIHSFTPQLQGVIRMGDTGILYDPKRTKEKDFSLRLQTSLNRIDPAFRVRRNYPYRGNADGFTTYLRKRFSSNLYLGIEIEINQNRVIETAICRWMINGLKTIIDIV